MADAPFIDPVALRLGPHNQEAGRLGKRRRRRLLAPQDQARALRAWKLRRDGMRYAEIGARIGVSPGRAWQVVQQGWDLDLRRRRRPVLGILYQRKATA